MPEKKYRPLADELRPTELDDVVVQTGSAAASNGPPLLNLNPPETRRIFALGDEIRVTLRFERAGAVVLPLRAHWH